MLNILTQLILGFIIALSGALIPGPLSVFIVTSSVKSGEKSTGLSAALGHCLVEVAIIGIIILGLTTVLESPTFQLIVNLVGGSSMIAFGVLSILEGMKVKSEIRDVKTSFSSLIGGIVFTVFNATIPIWWATVGLKMLSQALVTTTMLGVLFWVIGHWLADISWFSLLGYSTCRGNRRIGEKFHSYVIIICGAVMTALGLFFTFSSILP